jgi:hypothetical protein
MENIVADTLSQPPGHKVTPKRPSAMPWEPRAVKVPSRSAVAEAATLSLPLASVILPDTLNYRRVAANQKMCQEILKAATYPSLVVQEVELDSYTLLCNT